MLNYFWGTRQFLAAVQDLPLPPTQQYFADSPSSNAEPSAALIGQLEVPKSHLAHGTCNCFHQCLQALQTAAGKLIQAKCPRSAVVWASRVCHSKPQTCATAGQLRQPQPHPKLNELFAPHSWAAPLPS